MQAHTLHVLLLFHHNLADINIRLIDRVINASHEDETLDNLNINDVFKRCLETFDVFPEVRIELTGSYNEIIKDLQEDKNAE